MPVVPDIRSGCVGSIQGGAWGRAKKTPISRREVFLSESRWRAYSFANLAEALSPSAVNFTTRMAYMLCFSFP